MVILLSVIIAVLSGYLSLSSNDTAICAIFVLSIINTVLVYLLYSEKNKLKKEISGNYLTTAALSQDNLHDALTGLYNRRYFDKALTNTVKKAREYGVSFSVLMLDIDHFKKFNDKYGHNTGDTVLKTVARTVKTNIRGNQDMLFRYGGEEFIIITTDDLTGAAALSKKINALEFKGSPEKITVSIGIGCYKEGLTGEDVVKTADKNLYKAKEQGRNRAVWSEV